MRAAFTVVMPMKAWDHAKSRLHVEPAARRQLAEAFARDTLAGVLACPDVADVVVVTRGDQVVDAVMSAGARVVQEPADRPLDALGSAIRHGIAWAEQHRPHAPLAVVPSDLPALTAAALDDLLSTAAAHPFAFVPDANGDGTTIVTGHAPDLVRPRYGLSSAQRHRDHGAHELSASDALRQDVDSLDDLVAAARLGLGPHTRDVYARLGEEQPAISR